MKNNFQNKITQILINNFNSKNYDLVISKTKKYIKKYPRTIFFYNLLGSSYQKIGKQDEAIEIFNRGLKINPNNIYILNNLGNSYKYLLEYEKAEKIFCQIINLKPEYANAYINLGNLKRDINDFDSAIDLYEKANKINPNNFVILYVLALAYQGIGNFEKAIRFAKDVLILNPKFTKADYLISQSIKYKDYNWHYKELTIKLNNFNLNTEEKINLYFSLAKANEDLNNIENSFKFLKKANSLSKEINKYNINDDKKLFENIKKIFKNVDIHSFYNDKPNKIIFIIGMPRSGTSLLEQIISSHNNVIGGGEMPILYNLIKNCFLKNNLIRENIFEDNKTLDLKNLNIISRYKDYIKYFKIDENYIIDKSLFNFFWIGFIKILFPNSKIIHCYREPKDNCLSMYKNLFENGVHFSYDEKDIIEFYKMYQDLMKFWQYEKSIRLIDVKYEALINDNDNEIKRIIEHCDLNWDKKCLSHYENRNPIKTMSTSQARKPIYKTSIRSFDKYKKFLNKIDNSF